MLVSTHGKCIKFFRNIADIFRIEAFLISPVVYLNMVFGLHSISFFFFNATGMSKYPLITFFLRSRRVILAKKSLMMILYFWEQHFRAVSYLKNNYTFEILQSYSKLHTSQTRYIYIIQSNQLINRSV